MPESDEQLLHLAQAADIDVDWPEAVRRECWGAQDFSDEQMAFVAALSPSVVVALLERLEAAEAALDVVEERLCTEVAIAVTLGQSGYTPAYSVLAEALEDTVEALVAAGRGVTGLQDGPEETK